MTPIDSRQLRAFQLLAETGSFTAAAKQMFVTQSAISHSIKALETQLDCSLFDRNGKKTALTAHGETLLRRADRILDEMREAVEEIHSLNRWGCGRLRIGATDTMCQYLLPSVLRKLRQSYPDCEVTIHADDTQDLLALLEAGQVDLVIGMRPRSDEAGIEFRPLFEDELVFAVAPSHAWAKRQEIPEDTLGDERFIIYARSSPTYQLVARHFRKLGLSAPQLTELGNMEAIKELAKIGMGVGVIAPWVIREELANGELVGVKTPGETMRREWGIFVRGSGKSLTVIGETFATISKTVSRRLETSP
jgi:DNA-binding transcriptional LysR family regulator